MSEEYLKTKVFVILKPMVNALEMAQPDDPMFFMLEWLKRFNKVQNIKIDKEREELENLRLEIKIYKKTESSKQLKFKNKKKKWIEPKEIISDKESYEISPRFEEEKFKNDLKQKLEKAKEKGHSPNESADAFGKYIKKENFVPRIIKKTTAQKESIKDKCLQCFIFNSLEPQDLETVINAFEEKEYEEDDYVIKQGEEGKVLYLVEEGELICEKIFKVGEKAKYLKTYHSGESFGELALLYNLPRAATIIAKSHCVLWALDRETFNYIVKDSAIRKREKYQLSLKSVHVLSTLDEYELNQICDAVKSQSFKKGDVIIKEGEEGSVFYMVDEGECYVTKEKEGKKEPEKVKEYRKGDYFGELALLHNKPRAASVIAKSDCKLLTLDKMAFNRLLGTLTDILKRNAENAYKI